MEDNSFVIDTMEWSFSRLSSFYSCKWEWYMHYILAQSGENGFFSEFGSLMHKILEKYLKGELTLFELNDYYEEHFSKMVEHDAPPNQYVDLRESYFQKGYDYLSNIGFELNNMEILGVEKKVHFEIEGKPFVGMIDALLRNNKTGAITILDHKSATIHLLKNGNISKQDQPHFKDFCRQLFLYSIPVIEEYGKVNYLAWNLFKTQNSIVIPWFQSGFDETIQWAKDTIHLIEQEKDWLPNNEDTYYCNFLCGQRNNACEYKY